MQHTMNLNTVEESRRLHLSAEAVKAGGQSALARLVGCSASQLGQYLNGHREIGHKFARHVELSLGLERGAMDQPYGWQRFSARATWPFFAISPDQWDSLPDAKRSKIEGFISVFLAQPNA